MIIAEISQEALDFLMNYKPANQGFTGMKEIRAIINALNLDNICDRDMRAMRNRVVEVYTTLMDGEVLFDIQGNFAGRTVKYWEYNNAMMSVCAVIDCRMTLK